MHYIALRGCRTQFGPAAEEATTVSSIGPGRTITSRRTYRSRHTRRLLLRSSCDGIIWSRRDAWTTTNGARRGSFALPRLLLALGSSLHMRHLETDDARTPVRDGISVLLVSDVRLLRDGLVLVLAETSAIRVIGTAATRAEAEEGVAKLRPDVVLLDMSVAHCIETGNAIRAIAPVSMVAFAAAPDEAIQVACVEAGISGFVPRDAGLRDLIDALTSVVRGEAFCSPQVIGSTFRRLAALSAAGRATESPLQAVSAREKQIIELIDAGLSNKEIAQRLQIGVATVKNHVHNILEKLHVARRGEAAARLRETRLMPPSPSLGSASLSSLDTARS